MMSVTTSARSNRPKMDKSSSKSQTSHNVNGPTVAKSQTNKPTADQVRIAQLSEKKSEDSEYNKKISQIMELTKKTEEEVVVALYDCDQDTNRTVNLLLEGGGDQGEWQEMGKKRKRTTNQGVQNEPEPCERLDRNKQNNREKNVEDQVDFREPRERSESSGRGRSRMMNDGPPRFQRAGKTWRGKENEENERNRSARGERGSGFGERGRGRGRGRGGSRGGSRGGNFTSTFSNTEPIDDWGDSTVDAPKTNGFETSPHIDTWTNDQAATKKQSTSWGEQEDWNDDDWTGNLSESTVFTARNLAPGTPSKDQDDLKPISNDGFMPTNQLPQPIDLSAILNQKPKEMDLHAQTNQATESLKSIMGIGTTPSQDYSQVPSMSLASSLTVSNTSPSLAVGSLSQSMLNQQAQRAKPGRSKMPPPSKIPSGPVEMPGNPMSMRLDVQFGFGADPTSSFDDTDTSLGSTFTSNTISHLAHNGSNADNAATSVSSLASLVQKPGVMTSMASSASSRQGMYQSPDTTPRKDDYQSSLNKSLMTPPDAYSQQERQTSPMIAPNAMDDADSSKFSSSYPSSYPRYQNKAGSTSLPHSTSGSPNSLTKTATYTKSAQYQSGFPTQQSNAFQSPSSSTSNFGKLGQFQNSSGSSGASYRGQASSGFDNDDNSPPGYPSGQAGSAYAQKQASQNNSYQSAKLSSYSQQSTLPVQATSATYSTSKTYGQSDQDTYAKGQSSSTTFSGTYSSQSASRQSDESYSGSQSSGNYTTKPSVGSSYQSNNVTGSNPYDTPSSSSSLSSSQSTGQQSTGQSYGSRGSAFGASSGLQTSPNSTSKLSDGLSKMTVKDSSLDAGSGAYSDSDHANTSTSLSQSGSGSSVNSAPVASQFGMAATTSQASLHANVAKASASVSLNSKAAQLPPGVPTVMGHNFIMGQPGMQYFGVQSLPAQPTLYSYEDLQLMQQRIVPGYYDPNALSFQPPTSLGGAGAARSDQNSIVSNVPLPYSTQGQDGSKLSRVDEQSPVQGSSQQSQSAHQQQYINAALAPSYSYYYQNAGILPGGPFSYAAPMFQQQVPPVSNNAHVQAASTSSSQFQQKPVGGYSSHGYGGYDDLSQSQQDFSKTSSSAYHMSQQSAKVSAVTGIKPITTSNSDLSSGGYGKAHSQGYDKQVYHHGGTPPPYGLPGGVAGSQQPTAMAQGGAYAQFLPAHQLMSHQHSQILQHPHQHVHQQVRPDQAGAMRPGTQPSNANHKAGAGAPVSKYGGSAYWNTA